MPARYARLPNPSGAPDAELEAAFDESDHGEETVLLNPQSESTRTSPTGYYFETVDYAYPPPGSPPGPSTRAFQNTYGNSNGVLPESPVAATPSGRPGWLLGSLSSVLPTHWIPDRRNSRNVGGNDGVFANINAKPERGRVVQDAESGSAYVVPEDTQKDAPPSYASAQADAVPTYWETTVHAPLASSAPGEMIVDGLPTGSLFSYLWNLLISVAFQFVGFLLTFLLHSTHAAKLGSRTGLGVTLIQYGFYIRTRNGDKEMFDDSMWSWSSPYMDNTSSPVPPMPSGMESNSTFVDMPNPAYLRHAAAEWLSFLLMTLGWFILLTSILSFWRVKRWERSIIASSPAPEGQSLPRTRRGLFESLGFPGASWRDGLGLRRLDSIHEHAIPSPEYGRQLDLSEEEMNSGRGRQVFAGPETQEQAHAREIEERLQRDLRAAGLL